ncbi:MAG: upp [Parachlamydiales bacterium]|nr:upp [Parachlamydiales bacterium]
MKEIFLTTLRQSATPPTAFRQAAGELSRLLAAEASRLIPTQTIQIQTPLSKATGARLSHRVILTTILRSGLAMLPSFQELFPAAPIGFFGMRRDEKTAIPRLYYQNLPKITRDDWVFLLDPMLATGGSSFLALEILADAGASPSQCVLVSIVAAQPGVDVIRKKFPALKLVMGAIDPSLNDRKFIVPGLGDFGDRYFDTVG